MVIFTALAVFFQQSEIGLGSWEVGKVLSVFISVKYLLLELVFMDTKGLFTRHGSNKYFNRDNDR